MTLITRGKEDSLFFRTKKVFIQEVLDIGTEILCVLYSLRRTQSVLRISCSPRVKIFMPHKTVNAETGERS